MKGKLHIDARRLGEWFTALLSRDWGTKVIALGLSLLVFIVTREDVERLFIVPLRVVPDPDRVLLTEVPEAVRVELHGPWSRVSRLSPHDVGDLVLDLRKAQPGPLELDPAAIVMPEGVILHRLDYDRVDLRFDPVIERGLPIVVPLVGQVHADYELVSTTVEPGRWRVRGGREVLSGVSELQTERINLAGAVENFELTLDLQRPAPGIRFVGAPDARTPTAVVRAVVRPRAGETEFVVPLTDIWSTLLGAEHGGLAGTLPPNKVVHVRGPIPALTRLREFERPVVAAADTGQANTLSVRLQWAPSVPEEIRTDLTIDPPAMQVADPRTEVAPG